MKIVLFQTCHNIPDCQSLISCIQPHPHIETGACTAIDSPRYFERFGISFFFPHDSTWSGSRNMYIKHREHKTEYECMRVRTITIWNCNGGSIVFKILIKYCGKIYSRLPCELWFKTFYDQKLDRCGEKYIVIWKNKN